MSPSKGPADKHGPPMESTQHLAHQAIRRAANFLRAPGGGVPVGAYGHRPQACLPLFLTLDAMDEAIVFKRNYGRKCKERYRFPGDMFWNIRWIKREGGHFVLVA